MKNLEQLKSDMFQRFPDSLAKLIEAEERVAKMDKIDGLRQADLGLRAAIDTSISAISAGLNNSRTDTIYDAVVMLCQILDKGDEVNARLDN